MGDTEFDTEKVELEPDTAGDTDSVSLEEYVQNLEAALAEQTAKAEEEHNRYLRALADFSNYKRRQEENKAQYRNFAVRELILNLLSVVDDFERAMAAAEESRDFESLYSGLQLTLKKILSLLEAEGVKPIEALGQEFDPTLHEAVMRLEDDTQPENTIVQEHQKGYLHGEECLRPSRVGVVVNPD